LLFPNLFSLLIKLFFVFLIWRGFQSAFFFVSLPGTRRFLVQFRMGRRAFFVASARRFFAPAVSFFGFVATVWRVRSMGAGAWVHCGC
jgi:hypothetical protein